MRLSRRKPVLVLGCGPAGLLAAHAAELRGHPVEIVSRKRKSEMYGAQYLHQSIPLVQAGHFLVNYQMVGSYEQYRQKVYGPDADFHVSPQSLMGTYSAWDIRAAYDFLWGRYKDRIIHIQDIDYAWMQNTIPPKDYRMIVLSLPAQAVCRWPNGSGPHRFIEQSVYAIGDAPGRGVYAPKFVPDQTVTCNGLPEPSWYRASCIQGYASVEWPARRKPPVSGVTLIKKPIKTNCDCWWELSTRVVRVGRYGTWTKGVLAHQAFYDVFEELK